MHKSNAPSHLVPAQRYVQAPMMSAPASSFTPEPPPSISLVGLVRRQWFPLLLSAVLGAVAAYYVGEHFSVRTWHYTSKLLYHRTMAGDQGSPGYRSPDLPTVATLAVSRKVFTKLNDRMGLDSTPEDLAEAFHVHAPMSESTLEISVEWPEEEQGRQVLNAMIEVFTADVNQARVDAIDKYVTDYEHSLKLSREAVTEAKERFWKFGQEQGFVDVVRDLERIKQELSTLESALVAAELRRKNCQAQLDRIAGMQDTLVSQLEGSDAASTGDGTIPRGQLIYDRQMHEYLQTRIDLERKRLATQAELALKTKEFERAKELHAKRYISTAEFERIEMEYNLLIAQQGGPLQKLQSELDRIEENMPRILREEALQNPAPAGLGRSIAEIELEMIACDGEIDQLDETIIEKREEFSRISQVRREAEQMQDDINVSVDERQRLERLLASFHQLQRSQTNEFSILQPATLSEEAISSNRQKLMIGVFALVGLCFAAPIFGWEIYTHRERPAQGAARRLGLPVLAQRNDAPWTGEGTTKPASEFPRLLALKIQQAMQKPDSVLLFSSLSDRPATISLIASSAHCFVQRGERVLLMDVGTTKQNRRELEDLIDSTRATLDSTSWRNGAGEHLAGRDDGPSTSQQGGTATIVKGQYRGVSDFIVDPDCPVDQIIQPTTIRGVDCIGPGYEPMPSEGLGTHRLTELLDELRTRYTMVLVAGPTTAQPVDLAMFAARTDGIVFSTEGCRSSNTRGEEVVRELVELNAPILGFVE